MLNDGKLETGRIKHNKIDRGDGVIALDAVDDLSIACDVGIELGQRRVGIGVALDKLGLIDFPDFMVLAFPSAREFLKIHEIEITKPR